MGLTWIWAHIRQQPLAALASLGVLVLVGVLVGSAVAWQRGLDRAANAGADAALTYLVARGSEDAVERSLIEQRQIDQAKASLSRLEVAEELVHMAPVVASNGAESRVVWRGVSPETQSVRSGISLSAGKWPETADEVMVGQRMASELGIGLGAEVTLLTHSFEVVGIIDSRIGFAAGEIWMPLATLQEVSDRPHASKLVLRDAQSQVTFLTFSRPDIGLVDVPETAYLATVANGLQPLRVVAWIVAILLIAAAAAGAGGAAVARADARRGQFATARSLGIGVWRLGLWYLLETLLIAIVAWLVALLALMALDGTVLRLGTVAPELSADGVVLLTTSAAVFVGSFLTVIPTLLSLTTMPLAQQLRMQ